MASVETRMRRLSENARKTAENVKYVGWSLFWLNYYSQLYRHTIEVAGNGGLMTVEGKSATDSGSSPTANADMTLWKIVNKVDQMSFSISMGAISILLGV